MPLNHTLGIGTWPSADVHLLNHRLGRIAIFITTTSPPQNTHDTVAEPTGPALLACEWRPHNCFIYHAADNILVPRFPKFAAEEKFQSLRTPPLSQPRLLPPSSFSRNRLGSSLLRANFATQHCNDSSSSAQSIY
ncbi:hypothetical protein VTJ04DRAFT_6656 [Mycothermus thermophilus]|uniref:uncharacterized protein n=1 Tax=Humicola insolens TaxID=85995 RepID=UPI00374246A2